MNSIVLVLLVSVFALTSAASLPQQVAEQTSSEVFSDSGNETNERITIKDVHIQGRKIEGRILSSMTESKLQELITRMPEGFPEFNIPVLAPFVRESFLFELQQDLYNISCEIQDLRIEGLDDVIFNNLDVSYVFSQNIKYNVTFPKLYISGTYNSESKFQLVKQFGVKFELFGDGDFEVTLENLTFEGYFKYTMPIASGSISIYNFKGTVALENVISNFSGLTGESDDTTEWINAQIEEMTPTIVSLHQDLINEIVQDYVIPLVNNELDGKTLLSYIFD